MPRMARVILPMYPHHVVQRGHNRQVIFAARADYYRYLDTLEEFKVAYRVRLHAWCLMTNHVHLLVVPEDDEGLAKLMKRLGGRQTRFCNQLEGRSGTLWEGRYKSSVVQSEAYLFACCRYIELNPVRARMVSTPEEYPWSSCRERLGLEPRKLLDDEHIFREVGAGECGSPVKWRDYLRDAVPDGEWNLIRAAVQRGQLTGNDRFTAEIAAIIGRRIERRGCGRPATEPALGISAEQNKSVTF